MGNKEVVYVYVGILLGWTILKIPPIIPYRIYIIEELSTILTKSTALVFVLLGTLLWYWDVKKGATK